MKTDKIAIIGLGLIGGSLGMALCRHDGKLEVTGYDSSSQVCTEALARNAVHKIASNLEEAIKEAGLVLLAVPVEKIQGVVEESSYYFKTGSVVMDVGSAKGVLARTIPSLLPPGVYYVGGHPMTGAESSGIFAADPFLFQNAVFLLTPTENIPPELVKELYDVIKIVGGIPLLLNPEEHDKMVAVVSHLPHLLAAALVNYASRFNQDYPQTLSLAAGGFRDTTRVAMGSPALWREIFNSNRFSLLQALEGFIGELQGFSRELFTGEMELLEKRLGQAAIVRSEIPFRNKGFLDLSHELVVLLQDRPGAIAEVTLVLAGDAINIKDIEILRVREGEGGTLKLAFEDERQLKKAAGLLREQGFTVRIRGRERV